MGGGPEVNLGNYERLTEFKLPYAPVEISKYRSKKTGFQVVVANNRAPITNAYFAVATEIFDDTGRPHTLEHLIFLGSKNYPYKGVLDNLANRAGGDGTNAWTADDHTAYTISTAGSEGFLNMLPIYLDHILYPTITSSGFVTEVFHINGKGEEAGVVFSEMQGVEQNVSTILARKLQLLLYPEGSAYRSETGGMLDALRKLTVEEIREFHAKAYRPYNVCLVVDGSIPLEKLMHILNDQVDPLILSRAGTDNIEIPKDWKRPFLETPSKVGPVITKDLTEIVEFKDKDETAGDIYIAWKGPKARDYQEEMALDLLTTYLTDTEVAPLNKRFVEIAKPLCSAIAFYSSDRATANEVVCSISGVPKAQLESMAKELKKALKGIAEGTGEFGKFDLQRMKVLIERDRRQLLSTAETRITDVISEPSIGDFLYGKPGGEELGTVFDDLKRYDALVKLDEAAWTTILKRYLVDEPSITVIGKPSAALAEKLAKEAKEHLAATKEKLGEAGLKKKGEELDEAQKENDRPIPDEMITDFPISDASKIDWIPVESAVNPVASFGNASPKVQARIDLDGNELPYSVHYAHASSNFVTIRVTFDATHIPSELMPFLAVYQSSFFSLPVKRSSGVVGYEDVVNQLAEVTVNYDASLGVKGGFPDVFQVVVKVETDKYSTAVEWLRDLLTNSVFDAERLAVSVAKLIQDLPRRKRSANGVATVAIYEMLTDIKKSPAISTLLLHALTFLPALAEDIKKDPKAVVEKFERLRQALVKPEVMRLSVAGDILSMKNPRSTWEKNFIQVEKTPLKPLTEAKEVMTPLGLAPAKKAKVITIPSMEGSYGTAYAKGLYGWEVQGLAAAKLAANVLNALESYFWKHIRGAGLAYGAGIDVDEEAGLIGFRVWRSPNAYKAFKAAGDVVKGLSDGTIELEANLIDSARSSMSYTLAREENNVSAAASTVFVNEVFKQIPADAGARLLKELQHVTVEQVREAITTLFVPLFDSASSIMVVASSSGLDKTIQDQLTEAGYETESMELPSLGEADNAEDGESGSDEDGEGSWVEGMSESGEEGDKMSVGSP